MGKTVKLPFFKHLQYLNSSSPRLGDPRRTAHQRSLAAPRGHAHTPARSHTRARARTSSRAPARAVSATSGSVGGQL